MKRGILVVSLLYAALLFYVLLSGASCFAWEWEDAGGRIFTSQAVLAEGNSVYAASGREVLKRSASGQWESVLSVRGSSGDVNFLLSDQNLLYAATDNGLFCSHNQGKNWKKIFKGRTCLERQCVSLAVLPCGMYLGTREGLFFSCDRGRFWRKEQGRLGKAQILSIAYHPGQKNYIYLVSSEGVFRTTNTGRLWEEIFSSGFKEDADNGEEDSDEECAVVIAEAKHIAVDANDPKHIYLATKNGIYRSENRGTDWDPMPEYGLLSRNAGFLLVSAGAEVYAAVGSGIFRYKDERWQELSLELFAGEVNALALDSQGGLYAACEQGVFRLNLGSLSECSDAAVVVSGYSQGEPAIGEVQRAALHYAEVAPEKIINWRKRASVKALLPEVTVGLDRNVTDLWHWEGGSTTRNYDDLLIKGKDSIEWDLSISWDLSELIWNDAQTSIDARSRLMVQLRDDILDEVTKLYFQRLRVKMEMEVLGIAERSKRARKQLQIAELTASIDALTGGYFSDYKNK